MGKYLALVLVIPLLFSCAARKVAVTKTQTQTYTDSVAVEKKDSVSVKQNAIVITDSSEEIEVTPIDTAKPIIIGETKYYNAKVKVKKVRTRLVDSSTIVVSKSTENQVAVKKEVKAKILTAESKPYSIEGNEGVSHRVRLNIDGEIFSVKSTESQIQRIKDEALTGTDVEAVLLFTSRKEKLAVELESFSPVEE